VLERRVGIPISLALLYMEIGQQIGLALRGVSFPGHFLVKLRMRTGKTIGEVFIDPCDGQSLSREQLEQRMSLFPLIPALRDADPREIIVRMLRNLKSIYSERHDFEKLLDVQKRLVIVSPDRAEERRDRGLVYAQLDCPHAALEDLSFYLQANPKAPDADELLRTVAVLRNVAARPRH
jgi:regulator of sirC expression with transglutaminase-like and TPR domain